MNKEIVYDALHGKGKIYIAGKISGTKDYVGRFCNAEHYLRDIGYEGRIINPVRICEYLPMKSATYSDYIHIGLEALRTCGSIYMLNGWEDSLGASLELQYALTMGYKIFYEEI